MTAGMIRVNIIPILGLIFLLGSTSCEKETDVVNYFLDGFKEDKYYDSEIFNEPYLDIYGKWDLYGVSGGLHGSGHEPTFDFLEIKRYGIYGFIRNDTIIVFGKIIIDERTNETLLIAFEPDENSEIFMYYSEKYVNLYGKDTLSLDSPCCDDYNYHFIREK